MARRRKKKQKRTLSHEAMLVVTGMILMLCILSVAYGLLVREPKAAPDVRIEVWNGTGEAGLARRVAIALRSQGVDVLGEENADRYDYAESVLVERRPTPELREFADFLGCENVVQGLVEGAQVDATLIVGADVETLNLDLGGDSTLPR